MEGKVEEKSSLESKRSNAWCRKANVRKNGVPKVVKLALWEIWVNKSKAKMLEKEPKKKENEMKRNPRKNGLKWRWRETKKDKKNDLSRDKNDPWSDQPEIQFRPIYPFFRNHKSRPTLLTLKVHFDRMWIFKLKRFLLEEFCIINRVIAFFPQPKSSWWIIHPFGMNFEFLSAWWDN